ncbi:MAG: hypothetical protein M3020_25035 [Myxococcota bacterium]|nr:hypothetical protein [Myxococcota bacterium]
MSDAEAPDSQTFEETETPTVIAGRRHLRTLAIQKLDAPQTGEPPAPVPDAAARRGS